ncbi:TBC1 domain family member 14 isoform X2 [Denticeps clupeoides]|uniref:TBC1 domain family member 14 isoform X2 n=1 Tax=Denticeps clupeoides TaxID=299321 RepID=UPI0010A34685|nr:TBC1 domain family member 14 isoform X2 [Denticeps clupeoides]
MENGSIKGSTSSHQSSGVYHLHGEAPTFPLPTYKPTVFIPAHCGLEEMEEMDVHSLASQDLVSIPTLEIHPPEQHIHTWPIMSGTSSDIDKTPATLPLEPSGENILHKSFTFPRSGFDGMSHPQVLSSLRVSGGGGIGGTLNRSDDISVCSVSSLSTELSTSLSLSNEDIVDFMVTPDSSAVITLETDEAVHFSDVALSSSLDHNDLWSPKRRLPSVTVHPSQLKQEEGSHKLLGPLASFLNRGLFTKRLKDSRSVDQRDPGWKLFGKVPPVQNSAKDSRKIHKEHETKCGQFGDPTSPRQSVRKNLEFEPLSTTALILEDRPANLPAKPAEEAQKHRQQYEEMVAQAKKRELKEAQKRRKQLEVRCKMEESIGNAALTWNQEILPKWHSVCASRRVRDLCWQGVPPCVRGKVWSLAVGNELNITHELFNICLSRAREKWKSLPVPVAADTESQDREASLELIKLDISRTFPNLCIFQQGGPYHDVLHSILGAYTCYRPDVGYVQGMSFIAAVLILNMDTADAFIAFANLLNKPCQMAFYRVDHSLMLTYFAAFEVFFEENLPKLFAHFKDNKLTPDIYLIDWIFTLYSKSLPLDLACRVWDVFCQDGDEFLFRSALGILRLYDDILTRMDFIHNAQFLTRLPEDISADELFNNIAAINMQSKNKKWAQVLQNLQKEQERGSPVLKRS